MDCVEIWIWIEHNFWYFLQTGVSLFRRSSYSACFFFFFNRFRLVPVSRKESYLQKTDGIILRLLLKSWFSIVYMVYSTLLWIRTPFEEEAIFCQLSSAELQFLSFFGCRKLWLTGAEHFDRKWFSKWMTVCKTVNISHFFRYFIAIAQNEYIFWPSANYYSCSLSNDDLPDWKEYQPSSLWFARCHMVIWERRIHSYHTFCSSIQFQIADCQIFRWHW
jgi:hypothetical protein